jgi:hypothetical protein
MERFVFIAAVTIAVIFGIAAVFGGPHLHFDVDGHTRGAAPVVEVSPGRMEAQAFTGDRLRIRYAAAQVVITPEERGDFQIEIDNSAGRAPMPTVSVDSGRIIIDGRLRGRVDDCNNGGAELRGYGELSAEELPRITIRAPRSLLIDRGGAGTTEIGPAESVDLDFSGCGDVAMGDIAGALELDVAGSGQVRAGAARTLDVDLAGSGEVSVGAVAEGAEIDVAGAGTVTIASLAGDLSADGAGSGNVVVQGGAIGRASIDLAGSGDVDIAAPVRTLDVSIVGSGDVDVAAEVGDIEADIAGSGSVTARSVTGTIRKEVWGSGDVRVGG